MSSNTLPSHPAEGILFLILTGISGSGKSHALNCLEDMGYFCVDNLPLALIGQFAELCEKSPQKVDRVALVVDVRERFFLKEESSLLSVLKGRGHRVETLYFDADDAVLIRRFSETRRPHPLSPDGSIIEGLAKERAALTTLRNTADRRIDTSAFSVHDLRAYMLRHYGDLRADKRLTISLLSFGYKYGIPLEADLLFDVRFLPNPHFVPALKDHTGNDTDVRDFVLASEKTGGFLEHLWKLLEFAIPQYEGEGRSYLTIGIGCTGGKHRSVVIANWLARRIAEDGNAVEVRHRDVPKNQPEPGVTG